MELSKKRNVLAFQMAILLLFFAIIIIASSAFFMYKAKIQRDKDESEELIESVASFLENLMLSDGVNFAYVQDYIIENYENINIRRDFTDCHADRRIFEQLFSLRYSGKTLGVNIKFAELDDEVKTAYAIYKLEYFWDLFEKSARDFHIHSAYYLIPTGEKEHTYRFIDKERAEKIADGKSYLRLLTDTKKSKEEHKFMWEAWEQGKKSTDFDYYDSLLSYSVPLTVNGRELGVIVVEKKASEATLYAMRDVLRFLWRTSAVIAVCILFMLIITKKYISKITELKNHIRQYALSKNVEIAKTIEDKTHGKNEIASLYLSFAEMIRELENYMLHLSSSRQHAAEMNELINKDALTGIRNAQAFEAEAQKLDWKIAAGYRDFGIAIIDMNFLKRVNDTFGHDKGNIAIKKLCYIVCHQFEHSPVFRIGGDEFAVILEDSDLQNIKHLTEQFNNQLDSFSKDEALEEWEKVSASLGYALFDEMLDESAKDVLERAKKQCLHEKKR